MGIILANAAHIALAVAAEVVAPPPPVDLEQWAVENIVFSEDESDYPGPYNPRLWPFFSEILAALGPNDPCRTVTFRKSAQLGGTVMANIFTLGSQALDPCNLMYVHPTENNGRIWSKQKLKPMLRSTICLRHVFPEKPRDAADSVLFKERADGRGSILVRGANSPASLSMVTIARQVQDDLSKWEANAAGDPEAQADSRSRGKEFAKIFKNSTPLILPGCKISKNFLAGSQEVYEVPCPHCGFEHELEWANMLENLDPDYPERACFTCPDCGAEIQEHHRAEMVRAGKWVARNPEAKRQHRSFHLWSAYGPLQSWERIAREWFAAQGDPAREQVFLNDTVGEAYQAAGEAPPWEDLRDRANASDYARGEIPAGALVLTLGVDCQKDRVECQLVAWGRNYQRWVIDYEVINVDWIRRNVKIGEMGEIREAHISEPLTRKALDLYISRTWRNSAGRDVGIDLVGIDGNAWTEDVWDWARKHRASDVIMLRGVAYETAPLLARVKQERNRKTGKLLKYSKRFYNFATSILKMAFYRNVRKEDPAVYGFVHLPRGLDDEYFIEAFDSERRVPVKRRDGFVVHRWEKDPNTDNEALDTMLQAEAAAIKLGVRSFDDAYWDRLEAERESPPDDAQMDIEDLPLVADESDASSKPVRSVRSRRPRGMMGDY